MFLPSRSRQTRAIETARVIEELIQLAKDMRDAQRRGEALGLTDDAAAFYDALETNDSAVTMLGDEVLRTIVRELVATVRANVTIDWTVRENVRAQLRVAVKRILRKHGYPKQRMSSMLEPALSRAAPHIVSSTGTWRDCPYANSCVKPHRGLRDYRPVARRLSLHETANQHTKREW